MALQQQHNMAWATLGQLWEARPLNNSPTYYCAVSPSNTYIPTKSFQALSAASYIAEYKRTQWLKQWLNQCSSKLLLADKNIAFARNLKALCIDRQPHIKISKHQKGERHSSIFSAVFATVLLLSHSSCPPAVLLRSMSLRLSSLLLLLPSSVENKIYRFYSTVLASRTNLKGHPGKPSVSTITTRCWCYRRPYSMPHVYVIHATQQKYAIVLAPNHGVHNQYHRRTNNNGGRGLYLLALSV